MIQTAKKEAKSLTLDKVFHHDCAISSCQVIALHLIKLVLDFVVQVVGDFHFIEDDRKVYDQVQVARRR